MRCQTVNNRLKEEAMFLRDLKETAMKKEALPDSNPFTIFNDLRGPSQFIFSISFTRHRPA